MSIFEGLVLNALWFIYSEINFSNGNIISGRVALFIAFIFGIAPFIKIVKG